ncbi:MAG: FkbM family methyltransferase [Candidatus Paceibacterota bacterium]
MRIFLDVGAYTGDTAKAVLSSKHYFDKIYCFEPQIELCEMIREINNSKITVCEYGLWNKTCGSRLYWTNRKNGATIYKNKFIKKADSEIKSLDGKFVKASDWFRDNLKYDDYVVMKINCEGAECDILDDLFESGEYKKLNALMVDFDVRKIPTETHREQEIREKLKMYKIPSLITVEKEDIANPDFKKGKWTNYWMDKIL